MKITYHGPQKPIFSEVFMVDNLVFRWPKPAFVMLLGAHCSHWYYQSLEDDFRFGIPHDQTLTVISHGLSYQLLTINSHWLKLQIKTPHRPSICCCETNIFQRSSGSEIESPCAANQCFTCREKVRMQANLRGETVTNFVPLSMINSGSNIPMGSMGLEYLPTNLVDFYGNMSKKCHTVGRNPKQPPFGCIKPCN